MSRENSGGDFSRREELEARVVAMLLGEADTSEEAALRTLMEQDRELAAFYKMMEETVGLLHEAASSADDGETNIPMKMTEERKKVLFHAWEGGRATRRRLSPWKLGLLAAAASVAFGGGILLFYPNAALDYAFSPVPSEEAAEVAEGVMEPSSRAESFGLEEGGPFSEEQRYGGDSMVERSFQDAGSDVAIHDPDRPESPAPMLRKRENRSDTLLPETAVDSLSDAASADSALAQQFENRADSRDMPLSFMAAAPVEEDFDVAGGSLGFGMDLYRALREEKGNLFFSPAGLSTAMAMTYAGARGETARQIEKVFHFSAGEDDLHRAYEALRDLLDEAAAEAGEDVFRQVNSLWGQQEYGFLDDFLYVVERRYGAWLREVDFIRESEATRRVINNWFEEETQGAVEDFLPAGVLNSDTRLVLANALNFKGQWAVPFDRAKTREAPFRTGEGESPIVPMMNRQGDFGYLEDEGLQVIEIPYAGDRFSMVVFLPSEEGGLAALEESLSAEKLGEWLAGLRHRRVNLFFPRFEMTAKFSLKETLSGMGMPDAFAFQVADFSGMNGGVESLFIDEVFHEAYIEVDEEGTEAGAATGIVVGTRSLQLDVPLFRADRPFLFLIRETRTGSPLFFGRMAEP